MFKVWIRTALFNFFVAACLGALLRFAFVVEIPWLKYQFFQHAHSHVAMLGWVYLALYALLIHTFLDEQQQRAKVYRHLFWLTQGSVIGMLVTFPLMGYAGWSIFFSTLQMLFSYVFVVRFWRDLKQSSTNSSYSRLFIKAALVFMVLSTLALWGMGPIIALGYKGEPVYFMAVQFFLHFQFNGWFLFAILGLLFFNLEEQGWRFPQRHYRWFFYLLVAASVLTYALVIAWFDPLTLVFGTNSTGLVLQLGALALFLIILKKGGQGRRLGNTFWVRFLLGLAVICFSIKILVQSAVVFPVLAEAAYTIRNYVIGFIHLINLGIVSCFLLGYSLKHGLLDPKSGWIKMGLILFLAGLFGSETLLFLQGTMLWAAQGFLPYYYEGIFGISSLMVVGLGLIQLSPFLR